MSSEVTAEVERTSPSRRDSYSSMKYCYTHTDVSRVSPSVTALGGVHFMEEGNLGKSNCDFWAAPEPTNDEYLTGARVVVPF